MRSPTQLGLLSGLARPAGLALAALALAATASVARAQSQDGSPTMCSGNLFTATMGLSYLPSGADPSDSNAYVTVATTQQNNVLDLAECQCNSQDLYVEFFETAAPGLNIGQTGNLEVWVGSGCDQPANRVANSLMCERIPTDVTIAQFATGASGRVHIKIPALSIISPVVHMCGQGSTGTINFIFYNVAGGTAAMPDQSCAVTFTAQVQPPPQPAATASAGDGAVSLHWNAIVGTTQNYQILCADSSGAPIPQTSSHDFAYTTCAAAGTERRTLANGSTVSGGTDDGGVTTGVDASAEGLGGSSDGTLQPSSTDDGGVDGGTSGVSVGPPPFTSLDHMFVCSDPLSATTTDFRVDNLTNGTTYQFVVLAVDANGNATPSTTLTAIPQPVEDLYRRFREEGGKGQGFCFIATAAYGSYESPYVEVLREFRDRVLEERAWGRAFVAWYYAHSPPWAAFIAEHEAARLVVRVLLWPVIGLAALWLWLSAVEKLLLFALCLALLERRRLARWADLALAALRRRRAA